METATLTILCNPPKGFRGKVHFMFGINDETIAEGYANDLLTAEVPKGRHDITVLVRNEDLTSMNGVTSLLVEGDVSLRIRYALFGRKAVLVLNGS